MRMAMATSNIRKKFDRGFLTVLCCWSKKGVHETSGQQDPSRLDTGWKDQSSVHTTFFRIAGFPWSAGKRCGGGPGACHQTGSTKEGVQCIPTVIVQQCGTQVWCAQEKRRVQELAGQECVQDALACSSVAGRRALVWFVQLFCTPLEK
mmetsp:Transcript_2166/g.14251  ORF Transcript_2166/g.14251 Transcript_2166/m.14251 type:complete len:149 (-) Transcript_2166:655-1101(-)